MSYSLKATRSAILTLATLLSFGISVHAQMDADQSTEDARQAARTLVAANPLGTAPIQPAEVQAVIEATEEGGQAAAVIGLDSGPLRFALRLEAPLQSGKADFVTLDRLPGDAVVRGSIAYELFRGVFDLGSTCTELNAYSLNQFQASRALGIPNPTLPLLELEPLPDVKSASTKDLEKYVQRIRSALQGRPPSWGADLLNIDRRVLQQLCEAESNRGSTQYVEHLVGIPPQDMQDLLKGRNIQTCSLASISSRVKEREVAEAAAKKISQRYPKESLDAEAWPSVRDELDTLPQDTTAEDRSKKQAELVVSYREKLRSKKATEISLELSRSRAAYKYDSTLFMELGPQLLELMKEKGRELSDKDREGLVKAILEAFIDPPYPYSRKDALLRALLTHWPHKGPLGPATVDNPSPLPTDVSETAQKYLVAAEAVAARAFESELRVTLAGLHNAPSNWNEEAISEAITAARKVIPEGPVAESVRHDFLAKLVEPYSKLGGTFNQLPKDLIIAPSLDCSAKLVEARLAALPRSRERNQLFRTYAAALPTLMYFTFQGETGAKDFSWFASVPPVVNDMNQIPTKKETKYNSALTLGLTLFHNNNYWSLSYSDRRLFTAQDVINVCATFPNSDSTLCRQGAQGPPNKAETKVIEASLKRFFSPEFATHLQILYDRSTDTLNPHVYVYFFTQKDKGLRGGLDLSYLNHHPTQQDGFRGRLFFGVPFKPPF